MKRLYEGGLSLLLAEQDVARTRAFSFYAYVVEDGSVTAKGIAA